MGIVSSTFASLAIQLAWNCQRLLDPQYRCLEGKRSPDISPSKDQPVHELQIDQCGGYRVVEKRSSSSSAGHSKLSEIRDRKAMVRNRYKKRPASFDMALITNRADNPTTGHVTCVVTSTPSPNPSPLGRPQPQFWDVTSSSGCSSDSGSYLDSDSDYDDRLNEAFVKKLEDTEDEKDQITMSAEEEAALRMTVGRGHFSRSKKDRFLNHLRLEKRLNGLNNTFYGTDQRGHGRSLSRRYSGDLYRVTY